MEQLARLLRSRRTELGFSQRGLANEADVPYRLVRDIEFELRSFPPNPEHLSGLSRALELSPAELLRAYGYKL